MSRLRVALIASMAAFACSLADAAPRGGEQAALQAALDDLARYGVLGAVLEVDRPRKPAATFVTGFADGERKVPMSADRAFQIGSQTKTFTAAAILLLAKDGRLKLDDPVRRYVPKAAASDALTIRHLLNHTGGAGDGVDLIDGVGEPPDTRYTFDDILFLSAMQGLQSEPGARWHYNNSAFDVLGRIVEIVSGESRASFIRKRVLQPLKMQHTFVGSEEDWSRLNVASGLSWSKRAGKAIDRSRSPDLTWASSAGDMLATSGDMALWMSAITQGGTPLGLTLDDFTRDAVPTKIQDPMDAYGNGIGRFKLAGREAWGHGGFIHGFISVSVVEPATQRVVVLLASLDGAPDTNYGNLKTALTMVAAAALGAPLP